MALAEVLERQFADDAVQAVRTAVQMQYQLSAMADQKAGLLMGASFVVFTIAMAQAMARGGALSLAMLVLGIAAFMSAICAAVSVLPTVGGSPRGRRNLMFFGSFDDMDEDSYVAAMLDKLGSQEAMFAMMARDVFQNGQVLARKKYRLLRLAYVLLIGGLVASLIAFVATGIR
jgi:hypothetical protein